MKKIFTLVILLTLGVTQTQIYAQCFNCETNTKAFTIGSYTTATGDNSFSGGYQSFVSSNNGFAFGNLSTVNGLRGIALGNLTTVSQTDGIAIGSNALSNALNSYVFGQNLSSQGENSITIGLGSSSSQLLENNKNNSIMFGVTQNPTLTIVKPKNADVGYLGIGTDEPKEMVHLQGKLLIERTANTPSSLQFKHHITSTKDIINPPNTQYYWDIYSDVQGLKFNTISNLNTNPPKPDQRVVITSTGSVGIGAGNPLTNFQIGALWTFQSETNGNNIGRNSYNNGAFDTRIQSGAASRLSFNSSGDILMQTTSTGDAGSSIRWNTVTVAGNGDVGIGTTAAPAAKLEVAGGFKAQSATIDGATFIKGNLGIGIPNPTTTLDVKGAIRAHEVKVCLSQGCDFVFEEDYELMSLSDLNNFIKTNKHLPGVAPAAEMEAEGINLSEMNTTLLQKVEELTLYILDLQKQIDELKNRKP